MDEINGKKWTHERKLLLLTTRLRHESDFCGKKKKRNTLWEQVLREIKEVDNQFPFSRDDINRAFMNIMVTYKRIKKRNGTSGEAATTWEFFDQIDEVYGSRSSIQVPDEILEHSLEILMPDLDSPSQIVPPLQDSTPTNPAKKRKCEVLEFLNKESEKDERNISKLMELEAERLKVEKEKIDEMKKIHVLLEKLVNYAPSTQ